MILKIIYKIKHPGISDQDIPYAYKRSIIAQILHILRKGICQNIAPNCVLNPVRIVLYRLCGFKIGKNCFIGMKCYLDDLCVDKIEIADNVTISYGVYFSAHGRKQGHNKIVIKNGAYIGMRANIIARCDIEIGEDSIVGAGTLVNKSIPPGSTCIGVPGRLLRKEYD